MTVALGDRGDTVVGMWPVLQIDAVSPSSVFSRCAKLGRLLCLSVTPFSYE